MEAYIYELAACIIVIITVYLISGRFRWFGRSEIYNDVKPDYFVSSRKVKAFFRSAVIQSPGDYNIRVTFRKELLRIQDRNGADLFYFQVDDDFFQQSDSVALGRAAKLAGFIERQANPGKLTENMRMVMHIVMWIIYIVSILVAVLWIGVIFSDDMIPGDIMPLVFLILLMLAAGHVLLTLKECILYRIQNQYSMNLTAKLQLETDVEHSIRRYLQKTMRCYIGVSVLKIMVLIILLVLFISIIPM